MTSGVLAAALIAIGELPRRVVRRDASFERRRRPFSLASERDDDAAGGDEHAARHLDDTSGRHLDDTSGLDDDFVPTDVDDYHLDDAARAGGH